MHHYVKCRTPSNFFVTENLNNQMKENNNNNKHAVKNVIKTCHLLFFFFRKFKLNSTEMESNPEKDSQPGNVRELDFDDEILRGKGGKPNQ